MEKEAGALMVWKAGIRTSEWTTFGLFENYSQSWSNLDIVRAVALCLT